MKITYIAVTVISILLSAYCLGSVSGSIATEKALRMELYRVKSEVWKYKTELALIKDGKTIAGANLLPLENKRSTKYLTMNVK